MAGRLTVIYEAQSAPEALRLKQRLEAAGIPAVADVEQAEREEVRDWALPVPVHVAVDAAQAEAARPIVEDFDRESHKESHRLTVIYEARTVPEAQALKERLQEAGIPAALGNEIVEGESANDVWGLPEPARVAVDQGQAQAARRIAEAFDAEIVARERAEGRRAGSLSTGEDGRSQETASGLSGEAATGPTTWPRCPECGTFRPTRCPACRTTGTLFPQAEILPGSEAATEPMVLCPECDEAFAPQYARRCPKCGHEFADGFSLSSEGMPDWLTPRVLLAVFVLVAIFVAMLVYFATLL